jgi:aminoglycoside 6'-N-acetyltransferase I
MPLTIAPATPADAPAWAALRNALWPGGREAEHAADIAQLLAAPGDTVTFIARRDGEAIGFAEAALRHDYVNGCTTSPVAFLEGIYVEPAHRRHGVARALVAAIETWARDRSCTEFASDAALDNLDSHALHAALGFTETQRVVYFRKPLS